MDADYSNRSLSLALCTQRDVGVIFGNLVSFPCGVDINGCRPRLSTIEISSMFAEFCAIGFGASLSMTGSAEEELLPEVLSNFRQKQLGWHGSLFFLLP